MRGLFSYDGFLSQTLSKLTDCICLSILWLVCCIPLVTVGAATTALYYTVNKVVRQGGSGIWRQYWHSFRLNLKQATVVWLILVLVYGLLIVSGYYAFVLYAAGNVSKFYLIILIVVAAVVTMWANYLFPCLARFNNTIKQTMKNCCFFVVLNLIQSILHLIVFLATMAASVLYPIGLLFFPGVGMLLNSYIMESVFKKYISPEEFALEDTRGAVEDERQISR